MRKIYKVVEVKVDPTGTKRTSCIVANGPSTLFYSEMFWTKPKSGDRGIYCFDNIQDATNFFYGASLSCNWELWEVYYRKCSYPIQLPLYLTWGKTLDEIVLTDRIAAKGWPLGTAECKRVKLKRRVK